MANFGEKVQVGDVDAISLVPKIEAVKQRKETSNYVCNSILFNMYIKIK